MSKTKLFCIPHAGGSASIYLKWRKMLPSTIQLIPLELSGRGARWNEPLYHHLEEAVEDLYTQVTRHIGSDYILFGHSMGSLLAFELYYKLIGQDWPEPVQFIASGGKRPHLPRETIVHDLPLPQFKEHICTMMKHQVIFLKMMNCFSSTCPC
ncbi:thioesterase domain-containing protein [Paenibacillus alvei]